MGESLGRLQIQRARGGFTTLRNKTTESPRGTEQLTLSGILNYPVRSMAEDF